MAKEGSSAASGSPHSSGSMWKSHFSWLEASSQSAREGVESEAAEVSGGRRSYGRSPSPPGIPVLSDGAQRRVFSPRAVTDVVSHDGFGIFLCCCSTRLFTFVDLSPIFSRQDLGFGIDLKNCFF